LTTRKGQECGRSCLSSSTKRLVVNLWEQWGYSLPVFGLAKLQLNDGLPSGY
jgi:hypothetical protein